MQALIWTTKKLVSFFSAKNTEMSEMQSTRKKPKIREHEEKFCNKNWHNFRTTAIFKVQSVLACSRRVGLQLPAISETKVRSVNCEQLSHKFSPNLNLGTLLYGWVKNILLTFYEPEILHQASLDTLLVKSAASLLKAVLKRSSGWLVCLKKPWEFVSRCTTVRQFVSSAANRHCFRMSSPGNFIFDNPLLVLSSRC